MSWGDGGYLTSKSVVDPPYFFADQFGDGVASVVGKSLHKVLQNFKEIESESEYFIDPLGGYIYII